MDSLLSTFLFNKIYLVGTLLLVFQKQINAAFRHRAALAYGMVNRTHVGDLQKPLALCIGQRVSTQCYFPHNFVNLHPLSVVVAFGPSSSGQSWQSFTYSFDRLGFRSTVRSAAHPPYLQLFILPETEKWPAGARRQANSAVSRAVRMARFEFQFQFQ